MTYKLLAATALSLALGTAIAAAQTTTTQPEAGASADVAAAAELPSGWDGAIGDAFFADAGAGTLRSEDEIRANWEKLTEEQKAQVRSHCDTVDTAAAPATTEKPAGDTTAGAETDGDKMTTSSTTPGAEMHTAAIGQVCGWVDSM